MDTQPSDTSFEEGILFTLDVRGKKLGCSLLDCTDKILKVLDHDYQLSVAGNYIEQATGGISNYRFVDEINNLVESFFIQHRPTTCIISSRVNPDNLEFIERECQKFNCKLELQPNENFNIKQSLNFGGLNLNADGGSLLKLLQNSDETLIVTISTVNAILNYLLNNSNDEDNINSSRTWINTSNMMQNNMIQYVEVLSLCDRMLLDSDTIAALNIMPSTKYGQDKMIENGSFSIFQLFNRTNSSLATTILKNWLLFPLTKISDIKARSDIVKLFLQPTNSILYEDLKLKLRKSHNMYSVFNALQDGNASYRTWAYLYDFLTKGIEIFYLLSTFSLENIDSSNAISQILLTTNIKEIRTMKLKIESIINIEEMLETKNIVLIQGLDVNLDKYHQEFHDIELILEETAFKEEQNVKNYLSEICHKKSDMSGRLLNIIYIPQMGYLASISKTFPFQDVLPTKFKWNFSFETSTTLYFTTPFTTELDESYGDIYSFILDLKVEIIHELQDFVLGYKKEVLYFHRKLAELDILSSFATIAQLFSYTEPLLTEDNCCINITQGRHPLYESIVQTYIPNSLELIGGKFKNIRWQNDGNQRIILLTGANGSGKTVFLTQIGIIVYLAQIGSFVPANHANIGITDRIFTRINSKESLVVNRSSFESDTMQMSSCMSFCTERSLLLVDEFGKGTDSIDGPALFGSIIKYFSESNTCPRVVACTHFSELFQKDVLSTDIPGIQFLQTEVFISNEMQDTIDKDYAFSPQSNSNIFLYSIVSGLSTDSLGILCAKVCGMKETIIKRASELSKIMKNGENITQQCSKLLDEEVKAFDKDQTIIKEFLAWDLDLEFTTSEYYLQKKLSAILKGHKIQRDTFQIQ